MYKLFILSLVGLVASGLNSEELFATEPIHPDLNMTYFPPLGNIEVNLTAIKLDEYPWIARLIHSTKESFPHICTATCIARRLFVSAARCILRLKVAYTRVYYRSEYIMVRAFVVPSRPSKQQYQDVGIVVTQPFQPADEKWETLKLYTERNRTDGRFAWLNDLHLEKNRQDYYVVGFASSLIRPLDYKIPYHLYKLNVVIDMLLCNKLTRWNDNSNDYYVPCYHSCSVKEHKDNNKLCQSYLGVEGGALVNVKTNTLMGIATWAAYGSIGRTLPVGFTVPNSVGFYRDYACAIKIRDDNTELVHRDLYQTLCDGYHKSKTTKKP